MIRHEQNRTSNLENAEFLPSLDGQISYRVDFSSVQPHLKKYFGFSESKSVVKLPPSRPTEGRLAIVTDAGRDAVDAGGAKDESASGGRRSRVVLTPRRWRQVCETKRRRR
jgi:hypothetical protein